MLTATNVMRYRGRGATVKCSGSKDQKTSGVRPLEKKKKWIKNGD